MPVPKLKNLFVSETCLRFCALDLRISFLALAIASKNIQNCQWNSLKVVAIWRSQWNLGFSLVTSYSWVKYESFEYSFGALNEYFLLTLEQIWNVLLEEHNGGQLGNAVGLDGLLLGRLDERDVALRAVVVNRLHFFQQLIQFPGFGVVWKWQILKRIISQFFCFERLSLNINVIGFETSQKRRKSMLS